MSRWSRAGILVVLTLLSSAAAGLDLRLTNIVTEQGNFEFDKTDDAIVTEPPTGTGEIVKLTPHFRLWAYRDEIKYSPAGYFKYEIYVRERAAGAQAPITRFTFHGTPVGTFEDQVVLVRFEVTTETLREADEVRLPIFGKFAPDALSSTMSRSDPVPVFMASEKTISVPLTNDLNGIGVEVLNARLQPDDGSLWDAPKAVITPNLQIDPKRTVVEAIQVRLSPKPATAFASAMVPGSKNKGHDTVRLAVDYRTLGRNSRQFNMAVPVRFEPWPPSLFVMVVVGAFAGTLVPPATRQRQWRHFWRAVGSASIVAVLVEALAMVLVANNSQFKLLGFELDPFQLPSAALVGALVGLGGFRSLEAFRKIPPLDFWKKGAGTTGG